MLDYLLSTLPVAHGLRWYRFLLITVICLSTSPMAKNAAALQTGEVEGFAQYDLDGDDSPDQIIIDTRFASDSDRILIYDNDGGMVWGESPAEALRFAGETWLFDVGGDGTVQLAVIFKEFDDRVEADIYDDIDGDAQVSYEFDGRTISVTESPNWHIKVIADTSWLLPDGSVNSDLRILVDGYILRYLEWGEANIALDYALANAGTDGFINWRMEIVDSDKNGIPDYQLQRLITPFPTYATVFRATLYANPTQQRSEPYPDSIFWPLLVSEHFYEAYNYFDHPPAISIDWAAAKIDRIGILGYPIEQGYHVNSRYGWEKDVIDNYADFENPMAYYDLAGDQDGKPELFVRFEVFDQGDRLVLSRFGFREAPIPMTHVEYTWDSNNDGRWDYELGLGGRFPVTTTVQFADFGIRSVPYESVPSWVKEQEWDMAVFVAAEKGGYWDSEGMREWSITRGMIDGELIEPTGLRDLYLTGLTQVAPLEPYNDITEGFRGETAVEYGARPQLYISPVDKRLHLFKATRGVWVVDDRNKVLFYDLDEDGFFDQWQHIVDGQISSQLVLAHTHLIYTDAEQVIVKVLHTTLKPVMVEPPSDNSGRLQLEALVEPQRLDDLRLLLDEFDGELMPTSSPARDLRITEEGYRFLLDYRPAPALVTNGPLSLAGFQKGTYVVDFDGHDFSIMPATPPSLSLTIEAIGSSVDTIGKDQVLQVQVSNDGTVDARDLILVVRDCAGDASSEPYQNSLDVLANATAREMITFPPSSRTERLEFCAHVEDARGNVEAEEKLQVNAQAGQLSPQEEYQVDTIAKQLPSGSFLVLVLLAVFPAIAFLRGVFNADPELIDETAER